MSVTVSVRRAPEFTYVVTLIACVTAVSLVSAISDIPNVRYVTLMRKNNQNLPLEQNWDRNHIDFSEVNVFNSSGVNVAFKKSRVSSQPYDWPLSNSVDGNVQTLFGLYTSSPLAGQWWEVDLERTYNVVRVDFYGRAS